MKKEQLIMFKKLIDCLKHYEFSKKDINTILKNDTLVLETMVNLGPIYFLEAIKIVKMNFSLQEKLKILDFFKNNDNDSIFIVTSLINYKIINKKEEAIRCLLDTGNFNKRCIYCLFKMKGLTEEKLSLEGAKIINQLHKEENIYMATHFLLKNYKKKPNKGLSIATLIKLSEDKKLKEVLKDDYYGMLNLEIKDNKKIHKVK